MQNFISHRLSMVSERSEQSSGDERGYSRVQNPFVISMVWLNWFLIFGWAVPILSRRSNFFAVLKKKLERESEKKNQSCFSPRRNNIFRSVFFLRLGTYLYYPQKHKTDRKNKHRQSNLSAIELWQKKRNIWYAQDHLKKKLLHVGLCLGWF